MQKKEARVAILYARVKPKNKQWVEKEADRLDYRSVSEYLDLMIEDQREQEKKRAGNKRQSR